MHFQGFINILSKILGSIIAAFIVFIWIANLVESGEPAPMPPGRAWEGWIMVATGVLFLIGFVIGWWNQFYAGVIILVAALIVGLPFALIGNWGGLIFAIPLMLVSGLYFIAGRS